MHWMSILIAGRIVTILDEEEYSDTVMRSASEIKRVSSSSSEAISDQSASSSCSGTSKEAKNSFASCAFHS